MEINTVIEDITLLIDAARAVQNNKPKFNSIINRAFLIAETNRKALDDVDPEIMKELDDLKKAVNTYIKED